MGYVNRGRALAEAGRGRPESGAAGLSWKWSGLDNIGFTSVSVAAKCFPLK